MYFLCSKYFCVVLRIVYFVLFCVLFVCICVLYYCHRVATQLQLNISYHTILSLSGIELRFFACTHCSLNVTVLTGLQTFPAVQMQLVKLWEIWGLHSGTDHVQSYGI